MSAGLIVQCSVLEGHVGGGLQESPVRHLQGNAIFTASSYKQCVMNKSLWGIGNCIYQAYGNNLCNPSWGTLFGNVFDALAAYATSYSSFSMSYNDGIIDYTGSGGFSGAGNCPQCSYSGTNGGSPISSSDFVQEYVSIANWSVTYNCDVSTKFAGIPYGQLTFGSCGAMLGADPFTIQIYTYSFVTGLYTNVGSFTYSGIIDFSGTFTSVKSDALSQTFNWSVAPWTGSYNDYHASPIPCGAANGPDFTAGLTPSSYDNSITITSGSGSTILPAQTGWSIGDYFNSSIAINLGLAKNTTGVTQSYFIARLQMGADVSGSSTQPPGFSGQPAYPTGVSFTKYILTLESVGTVLNGQVIGIGQDINVPFPSSNGFPLINLGNTVCVSDNYIAVIGIDPSSWATLAGLTFGTITGITG